MSPLLQPFGRSRMLLFTKKQDARHQAPDASATRSIASRRRHCPDWDWRPAPDVWRLLLPFAIVLLPSSALYAGPPTTGVAFTQITASGVVEPVSISGVVYQDVNRSGAADAG